ncbi:GNAT family N-acetyltransferase [Bdellovibrio svalbardensis]|uniref:GNAT family N-acetyltransferase n=1 Tax=Bdellovibrio svalbardensis TaxID=2972972 RepID=A0ABT6DMZ2_9BACT|nr:GNAT family N-acetyltransferase [Bdellovibrio svalbardensis]MDG0817186.1 GNAT family N-acetyltransferase [Bdellovibrio svalbardensis]
MKSNNQLNGVSPRLCVRPYKLSDYKSWSTAVIRACEVDGGKDSFRKKVLKNRQLRKEDRSYVFGIFHKKTNEHLGEIEINIIVRRNFRWANLGYEIHSHYRNKGFAKEGAAAVLEIGHNFLDLHRIEAVMPASNKASIKVARALKMKKEGIRRRFIPMSEGWTDAMVFVSVR